MESKTVEIRKKRLKEISLKLETADGRDGFGAYLKYDVVVNLDGEDFILNRRKNINERPETKALFDAFAVLMDAILKEESADPPRTEADMTEKSPEPGESENKTELESGDEVEVIEDER